MATIRPAVGSPVAARRRGRPRKDARPAGAPGTKQLILAAAAEAFAGRGVDGASLADIAAAAGLTTGAVYRHFRGKPELLLDVVATTLAAADPLDRVGPDAGPQALRDWMAWLLDPAQSQLRALVAEINHAGARDPEVRALLVDYSTRYGRRIAEHVERWQSGGIAAPDRSATAVAQLFLTLASGVCVSSALRPHLVDDPAFRRLLDGQIAALVGTTEGAAP